MFIADYQTMRAGGGEDEQPTTATSDLGEDTHNHICVRADRQTDRQTQYIAIHRRPAIERSKNAGLRIDASKARIMCQGSTFTFTPTTVISDLGEDTHMCVDRQTDRRTDRLYIAIHRRSTVGLCRKGITHRRRIYV